MAKTELPHHHGEEKMNTAEIREVLERVDNFQTIADVFRQLGDTTRVRIFWLLCHCDECVVNIAAMLDKTPEEIAAMMDEAAAKGYIRGYETLVDWEQAGVNLVEAGIELRVTPHKARGFDDIGMTIAQFDEVDTVLLMSGSYDLQVIIKGRSFQEIAIFVAKRLSPLDDVLSTATSFVLRPYKRGGRLYLPEEPDERECTVL